MHIIQLQLLTGDHYTLPHPLVKLWLRRWRDYGEDLSDDEFLYRTAVPIEYINAMRAAGPTKTSYPRGDKPFMALLYELMQRKRSYIHIKKNDFSLTLIKR